MPLRALVIDDNHDTADCLAQMFAVLGYEVTVAHGPRQALESLARQIPNVIMTDIHMPGVEGPDVCRYIRRDPRAAKVPIIAMSTDTQAVLIQSVREAGANDFLAKPVDIDTLEKTLQAMMSAALP